MWRKLSGETLSDNIIGEVDNALAREKKAGNRIKLCVGTDSQVYGGVIEFATVIVFIREERGGFMFIHQDSQRTKMTIKERMLIEVARSIEVAYQLCPLLEKFGTELEVHADINTSPQFKSNTALSDAMGYILSMGFVFKAKPDAFASSYCANKIVS